MKLIIDKPFGLLLIFSGLLGIELFILYLLADAGLLQVLLAEDYSFISRVILGIYLVASLHVMLVSYYLSIESKDLNAGTSAGKLRSNVQRYFSLLQQPSNESDDSSEMLIEVLDSRCRGQFRFGYVVADLMLKLGLLGTVIGFYFHAGLTGRPQQYRYQRDAETADADERWDEGRIVYNPYRHELRGAVEHQVPAARLECRQPAR